VSICEICGCISFAFFAVNLGSVLENLRPSAPPADKNGVLLAPCRPEGVPWTAVGRPWQILGTNPQRETTD